MSDLSGALAVRVLGATEIGVPGAAGAGGGELARRPKLLALLVYLALGSAEGFCRRERLVSLFWPEVEPSQGRTNLRKALHAIRQEAGGDAIVTRGEDELRVDPARVWCDAVALRDHVRRREWGDALALFRGELLDGLNPDGVSQELEEWLSAERRLLRKEAARAAAECSRAAEASGALDDAVAAARRAIEIDVDDEGAVRRVLELLDRLGDRAGALRVYEDWKARLRSEYGVEPAPETRAVAHHIEDARKGESHDKRDRLRPARRAARVPDAVPRDDSPLGARRPPLRVAIAVAVLALAGTGAGWLWRASAPALGPRSVGVLPLRAIDPALAPAAAALGEELVTALAGDSALAVRPAGSDAASARAGVAWLVDGAVQGSDSGSRVTLRLVRARDMVVAWSASYDVASRGSPSAARVASDAAGAIGKVVRR